MSSNVDLSSRFWVFLLESYWRLRYFLCPWAFSHVITISYNLFPVCHVGMVYLTVVITWHSFVVCCVNLFHVVSSSLTHSLDVSGILFVSSNKLILIVQHQAYVLTSCSDYRQLWYQALFSKLWFLAQTFDPSQWFQMVDRITSGLVLLSFHDEYQHFPWPRSVSSFPHWSPQWASLMKSPAL